MEMRRYITKDKADELLRTGNADYVPTGARTFNVVTLMWTDWYVVPADDPRLNTVEEVWPDGQRLL